MKRYLMIGASLCLGLVITAVMLLGYQQQALAQTTPQTPSEAILDEEGEVVAITPVRLDGQIVLSVTVRVGDDLTVTTPITLDVASWIADLDGSTEISAAVAAGEPTTTITGPMTAVLTSTLTTTVDVAITGLITPVLSLVELLEDEDLDTEEAEEAEAEPVVRGEVLAAANLREGPGTDTPVIGSAQPGDIVIIVDINAAGDWYNLEGGEWIAGFLVQLLDPEDEPESNGTGTEEADPTPSETDATDDVIDEVADETADDAAIPAPTPTPAEEADAESAESAFEYRVAVITGLLNLATGVESMGGLMDDPQMLSAAWNDSINLQATVIRGSYQQIAALTPPADAGPFHSDLLSALADCDVAMELLTTGLENLDMTSLDQAATLMIQCGEKMEAVIQTYPEFLE